MTSHLLSNVKAPKKKNVIVRREGGNAVVVVQLDNVPEIEERRLHCVMSGVFGCVSQRDQGVVRRQLVVGNSVSIVVDLVNCTIGKQEIPEILVEVGPSTYNSSGFRRTPVAVESSHGPLNGVTGSAPVFNKCGYSTGIISASAPSGAPYNFKALFFAHFQAIWDLTYSQFLAQGIDLATDTSNNQ